MIGPSFKTGKRGGITRVRSAGMIKGVRKSAKRAPLFECSRMNLADFNVFHDDGTFMAASPTDLGPGLGWQFQILGGAGKSVADPFDGWYAISKIPCRDLFGKRILPASEWMVRPGIYDILNATNSSAISCVVGVCSEAQDSGTINALFQGTNRSASGNRIMQSGSVIAGTATIVAGSTLSTIKRMRGPILKVGSGTSAISRVQERAMDAANLGVAANGAGSQFVVSTWNDAEPYLFLACYRTSTADAVTRTVEFEPVYNGGVSILVPA